MVTISKQLVQFKFKAGLIHFLISLSIFGVVLAWVWFVVYPDVYFSMAGAFQGLLLVFLVDVVLGPLLSFLVYDPKKTKKAILVDFTVIGLVQVGAMLYGLNTLYQEHPKAVIVYKNSSATVLNKREIEEIPELNLTQDYSEWSKLPVVVYTPDASMQVSYQPLDKSLPIIESTDKVTRSELSPEDKASLENLEKIHGKLYVLAVLAKYNGAYFALSPDLKFVAKFGEKPMS